MSADKNKEEFLLNEYKNMSIFAALSTRDKKNPVYKKGLPKEKEVKIIEFKTYLKNKLDKYAQQYKEEISGNKHIQNIKKLTQEITAGHQDILHEGKFRIGITQKLLNLYLKYLWASDKITTPPHCPFDSKVISELEKKEPERKLQLKLKGIKWTALKNFGDYEFLVEEAKKIAKDKNLSEWELEFFNQKPKAEKLRT